MKFAQIPAMLMVVLCGAIHAQPVADFTASPSKGCAPLKVDFINQSAGASSYLWEFGNGNQSTLSNPSAVYHNPGKYTVKLIAKSSSGLLDSVVSVGLIEVFKSPQVSFSQDKRTLCEGETVKFEDKSIKGDGKITVFDWDFGDGGTNKGPKPQYVYNTAGLYHVTLTIIDTNGCESMARVKDLIQVNPSPKLSFTQDKTQSCKAPMTVEFDGTVTGKYPLSYEWRFGDGNTAATEDVTYTYNSSGLFDVSFSVTDGNKCTRTIKKAGLISIKPPTADFSANIRQVCPGKPVVFTPVVSPANDQGTYSWDFGNGDFSSDKTPETVFKAPGKYKITLNYEWDGCKATSVKNDYIEVFPVPVVKLRPRDTSVCRMKKGFYTAACSSPNAVAYSWWVNGTQYSGKTAFADIPLSVNRKYQIKVFPLSDKGCEGIPDSGTVTVRGPMADITASPVSGCIPLNVTARYSGVSSAPIATYFWRLPTSPQSTATSNPVNFTYNKLGKDVIYLKVTDVNGCEHDTVTAIMGGIKVNVQFETDVKQVCRNQPFDVRNLSTPRGRDTVEFFYKWSGTNFKPVLDSVLQQTRNITKFKLMSVPVSDEELDVVANSFGCISYMDSTKRPKVRVVGPFLNASVNYECDKDELIGTNNSINHTKAFWTWRNEFDNPDTSSASTLKRPISKTGKLKVFVLDSKSGCVDSSAYNLMSNPYPASFSLAFDCATKTLKTNNFYPNLNDGSKYFWEFVHQPTGTKVNRTGHNTQITADKPGRYLVNLLITHPSYPCDLKASRFFVVYPNIEKPDVTADRTQCFPVKITLKDPQFKIWKQAWWSIDNQVKIKDSAAVLNYTHIGVGKSYKVNLYRTDSNNCSSVDSVIMAIGGWDLYSNVSTEPINCTLAVLKLGSYIYNAGPGLTFQYEYRVLNRVFRNKEDTLHVRNASKFPFQVIVTDNKGCIGKDTGWVDVKVGYPVARFTVSDSQASCPPLNVNFTDKSIAVGVPIIRRRWDFGDNTGSALTNPGKIYIDPGKFKVRLIVTNSIGCHDTAEIPDLVVVNGPTGSLSIDRKQGCTPLPVNLLSSIGGNVAKYEFDMGDGVVLDTSGKLHRYVRPGKYIPRLILTDTLGCRYSPRPRDTIVVFPTPVAAFHAPRICYGITEKIPSLSTVGGDVIKENLWYLNDQFLSNADLLQLNITQQRFNKLELKSITSNGCRDSVIKPVTMFRIKPDALANQEYYCLGDEIELKDATHSDTALTAKKLWFNGQELPYTSVLKTKAAVRGLVPVRYFYRDAAGCEVDVTHSQLVKIGDTLPPPHLLIYRSTVADNYSTATLFKPSAEPDFKNYKLKIWDAGRWDTRQVSDNRNDTDLVVNGLNTLNKSYCHIISPENFCGKYPAEALAKEHCTVETKALGDTNCSRVWWTAYKGWDVQQYRIYRKRQEKNDFVLLDSVSGNTLSYLDTSVWCHVIYDYRIEALEKGGYQKNSFSDTARAKPLHLLSVPAPEVWRTTVDTNTFTRTEWLMLHKLKFPVAHFTLFRNVNGSWEKFADSLRGPELRYNDLKTRVQEKSYEYKLTATDVCNTTSDFSNPGLSILLRVAVENSHEQWPVLSWNHYRQWNEGIERYEIQRSIMSGDFVKIGEVNASENAFTDKTVPQFCARNIRYRVMAIRNQPVSKDSSHFVVSVSNYASFDPEIRFFIPNAFTPDENNLNESFAPKGVYYFSYHMKIFDRWGKKLYDNSECNNAWNGFADDKPAPDGVYAYSIEAIDMKGKKYHFSGTFHLLR